MSQVAVIQADLDIDALVREEVTKLEQFRQANAPNYFPANVEGFVRHCLDAHLPLIRRWGGWHFHHGPVQQGEIPLDQVRQLWQGPGNRPAPDCSLYQSKVWQREDTEIVYAWIHNKPRWSPAAELLTTRVRKGQAVSKAVLADLKRRFGKEDPYVKEWEGFFERLGHAWAAGTPLLSSVTCSPLAFFLLGHYGENTCYRTDGEHEHSKMNLAQMPGSVVLLFFETGMERTQKNVKGRMWGFLGEQGTVLTNRYRMSWAAMEPAAASVIRAAMGVQFAAVDPQIVVTTKRRGGYFLHHIGHDAERYVYIDPDHYWYLAPEVKIEDLNRQFFDGVREFAKNGEIALDPDVDEEEDEDWVEDDDY